MMVRLDSRHYSSQCIILPIKYQTAMLEKAIADNDTLTLHTSASVTSSQRALLRSVSPTQWRSLLRSLRN